MMIILIIKMLNFRCFQLTCGLFPFIINAQQKRMMQKSANRIKQALQQQITYALKSVNCEDYCFKGNEYHFKRIQEQQRLRLKNKNKIYCIDKTAIDVALEMAVRKQNVLTLLTPISYETVTIKTIKQSTNQRALDVHQQHFQQYLAENTIISAKNSESIPIVVSKMALQILNNYRFVIKSSSLDIHPFQSYKKLCGYILVKQDKKISKYFNQTSFSNNILSSNISLAAFMKQVRQRYINTDYYKFKLLPRRNPKEFINQQTKQSYLQRWKQAANFDLIKSTTKESFDQNTKIKWAIENKLGSVVTQEEIVKNKFRYYYYATWI